MANELPDTRSMLPSAARAAVTAYLLERLEASQLNCYADPMYTYAHALGEMREHEDQYVWTCLDACWQAAKAEYDLKHPKRYRSNVEGTGDGAGVRMTTYREGLPLNS